MQTEAAYRENVTTITGTLFITYVGNVRLSTDELVFDTLAEFYVRVIKEVCSQFDLNIEQLFKRYIDKEALAEPDYLESLKN